MINAKAAGLSIAAVIIGACTSGNDDQSGPRSDIPGTSEVVIVNGNGISEPVFRLFTLNAVQADADDLTEEGRAEIINRLIYLKLLADAAERNSLHEEPDIAAELDLARMQLLARAMTEWYSDENPPTAAELRGMYRENLPRLASTLYKTRHILVDTEAEASALLDQLNAGADFAELAREYSTGPTGPDGGDLDWITAQSVVEPFGNAIQDATPGEPYPSPVQTQYGWHVILVEDIEAEAGPGLEAVRQDLTVAVEARKLDLYLEELRQAAEVTIVE